MIPIEPFLIVGGWEFYRYRRWMWRMFHRPTFVPPDYAYDLMGMFGPIEILHRRGRP